ncbi:MAG: PQ-loop repeat-containing protein [Coxiellaceae bacterium]|nr:PQ-loop repeat-containing protein [Coxiellaceae bacterium]
MINTSTIGEWSLQLSAALYFIWFMPQLFLTYRRQSTEGLSLNMHCLLLLGYGADLIYGFGLHMPWLYRAVTLSGLLALVIQQLQFYFFNDQAPKKLMITDIGLIALVVINALLYKYIASCKEYFDLFGLVSVVTGFVYAWPQIIKNNRLHSVQAVSKLFVVIAIITCMLDMLSAITLQWDWPSKLGPSLALLQHGVLLWQSVYLVRNQHRQGVLA